MGNNYFKFKQFTVMQDACAMKVCTDACLFGSWVVKQIANFKFKSVLDIGTGTGLLSLILAQHLHDAAIDAIEIDTTAAKQAGENFLAAPWKDRLRATHADVKTYSFQKKYALIISNPPFYQNNLKSNSAKRNAALHSTSLNFTDLLHVVENNLAADGLFAVLLHHAATDLFIAKAAEKNLFVNEAMYVRQTIKHDFFRSMLLLSHEQKTYAPSEIAIKDAYDKYMQAFTEISFDR